MPRLTRFTFVVNDEERRLIQALAEKLQRSQSDAVRYIVTAATRELGVDKPTTTGQLSIATERGKGG